MQNKRPSLFRIVSTDYSSFISVLFLVMFDGFTVYFYLSGNDSFRLFLFLAVGVTLIGIPVLILRYRTISSVFDNGIQSKGVVTSVRFFRGRGRVEYSYTVQGEEQIASNAISRNSRTRKLRVGQSVAVIVDRDDPKRAFIVEIYL